MTYNLERKVRKAIAEVSGRPTEDVTANASLDDALGFDSLDRLELAMSLEEDFGLKEIPDEDWEAWHSVDDVVTYIRERTG